MKVLHSIILGLGIFAGAREGSAQQGGWMIDLDSLQDPDWIETAFSGTGRSIREVPSGFLVFSEQASPYTGLDPNFTHVFNRLLGPDGSLLGEMTFGSDSMNVNYGYIDPIADHPDGGFVAPVTHFTGNSVSGYIGRLEVCRYDDFGDTTWCTEVLRYQADDSVYIAMKDLTVLQDTGYLLGGFMVTQNEDASFSGAGMLIRTSPDGDTLWTRGYTELREILGVEQASEGHFLAIGYRLGSGIVNRVVMIGVAPDGELLWVRYMGNRGGTNAAFALTPDGDVVTWCSYAESSWPNDWAERMLTKWSSNGGFYWRQRFGYDIGSSTFDVATLPDGGFITTGLADYMALLERFDSNGELVWSREYYWYWFFHLLYDVEPTSDGGFIATGYAIQTSGDPNPGLNTIVALKTDSMGCVLPGCHTVGVEEYVADLHPLLRIWPNPAAAGGQIQAELPLPEGFNLHGAVRALLLDATGRQVAAWPMQHQGQSLRLQQPLPALAPGLYYLHLADDRQWLAGGKVVVE